jgi:hypothetical protein
LTDVPVELGDLNILGPIFRLLANAKQPWHTFHQGFSAGMYLTPLYFESFRRRTSREIVSFPKKAANAALALMGCVSSVPASYPAPLFLQF